MLCHYKSLPRRVCLQHCSQLGGQRHRTSCGSAAECVPGAAGSDGGKQLNTSCVHALHEVLRGETLCALIDKLDFPIPIFTIFYKMILTVWQHRAYFSNFFLPTTPSFSHAWQRFLSFLIAFMILSFQLTASWLFGSRKKVFTIVRLILTFFHLEMCKLCVIGSTESQKKPLTTISLLLPSLTVVCSRAFSSAVNKIISIGSLLAQFSNNSFICHFNLRVGTIN